MNKIVIVGGGIAGWMAAISIACRFPERKITVVAPSLSDTVGESESVTGPVVSFIKDPLHRLNINDFARRCDVTFNAGVWYKDWQGPGTEYLAPSEDPCDYIAHFYPAYAEDFFAAVALEGVRLGDVLMSSQLMRANRTDCFRNANNSSVNSQSSRMPFEFDAVKFAAWLRGLAPQYANITYLDDAIESVTQNPNNGAVLKIRTRGGRDVKGDFFIDCTDFQRSLFAKAFQPKWISATGYAMVDSAISWSSPYAPGQEMPTYAMFSAMPSGWLWQTARPSHFDKGYLFSSRHADEKAALADLRAAGVDPGDAPRVQRFEPGRFEKQWLANVCTIGLSAGFIEPLEASTIHGIYSQIRFLTDLFLPSCTRESLPVMSQHYNKLASMGFDDYLDFVNFRFHTGRADTEFWRDCQKPDALTPENQARLEKWRHAFPIREDFRGTQTQIVDHTLGLPAWAPMLCGLGILRPEHARRIVDMCDQPVKLKENMERYIKVRTRITGSALTHAESLQHFHAQT